MLDRIKQFLQAARQKRLVIFFDDFSEIDFIDQKLFVDVILAPLNNSSNEYIKLKVAGYPGRIYYGKIDPSKVETLSLDFCHIYKSKDLQTAEAAAVDYTRRLLETRFGAFGENVVDYLDPSSPVDDYFRLIFEATFNVPRLMGIILHQCYLDRVSMGRQITPDAIRLAARKHYESVIASYFDLMNRYALEPFEQKLDRHVQQELLAQLVATARDVRRQIATGKLGGVYFEGLTNPPVSHFTVSRSLEKILNSLELNFLLTKYHEMRDKDGNDVEVYAFFYGLCESERFAWGYPRGRRQDRSYFVQRSFNYTAAVQQFLTKAQTIRCSDCGACFAMEKRENLEFYNWRCPTCRDGLCAIVNIAEDFRAEVEALNREIMLESVELSILTVLHQEGKLMTAKEVSALLDITYQLVGKRTTKLKEKGLIEKVEIEGRMRSRATPRAVDIYFAST